MRAAGSYGVSSYGTGFLHDSPWGRESRCTLDGFLYFGGYPGGAPVKDDRRRWLDYLNDAIIEPSIAKDVIALEEVRKLTLIREKASSPRLMVHDTALMTATYGRYRDFLLTDPERRGHLVESAVGARLLALSSQQRFEVRWWREGQDEVDFVLVQGEDVIAVEVKSGRVKSLRGLAAFVNRVPRAKTLTIGSNACPLEAFLQGEVPLFPSA